MSDLYFSRPVGMLEKLYTARQTLGIYHSVIVTATYLVRPKYVDHENFLFSLFSSVIPALLHRHPPLCCYVEGQATPNPVFRQLNDVEVKDVLQILQLNQWDSLSERLQQLHDQPWSREKKPLWRLVVMKDPTTSDTVCAKDGFKTHVAFVYHHVIGDGLSGLAFHSSLFKELESFKQSGESLPEDPPLIETPISAELIDPIEKLILFPLSWSFLAKQVLREYAPRWLVGAPPPLWAGLPAQPLIECPFRSRVRLVSIQASDLEILVAESRKHGVTLTSLLTAALVHALANAVPKAPRFVGMTPYTLRRVTGTSMSEMVNQTSAFESSYPTDLLDRIRTTILSRLSATTKERREDVKCLWNTAMSFHAEMQEELARCPRDNLVGLLPYVSDHVQFYQKKFYRAREATWELPNLGVFKPSTPSVTNTSPLPAAEAEWKLECMTFTQGAQPVGAALAVNCVSVLDGPLTVAITWQHGVVEENVIEAVARAFDDLPARIGGEEDQ